MTSHTHAVSRRAPSTRNLRRRATFAAGTIVIAATFGLTACAGPTGPGNAINHSTGNASHENTTHEHALVFDSPWVKAGAGDMTSAFGSLSNPSDEAITLISAESAAARSVELHEMAMVDGAMVMRQLADDFVIDAGATRELAPGGEHLMLMGLTSELLPGDEITITLHFSDGTSLDAVLPVREIAGAEEEYAPEHSSDDHGDSEHSRDESAH